MGRPAIDLSGVKSGLLVAIEKVSGERGAGKHAIWLCRCACGNTVNKESSAIRKGTAVSCGCMFGGVTHGEYIGGSASTEMHTWRGMMRRCHDENDAAFKLYGARGIKVCDRWHTFENFLADMGRKPDGSLSIDRIDNDRGYEPGNCRWADRIVQGRNKRGVRWLELDGVTLTMSQWAERVGVTPGAMCLRLKTMTIRDALTRKPWNR